MTLTLFAAAVLPALLILRYFRNGDRFPEPVGVLMRTFFFGVLIVVPVFILVMIFREFIAVPAGPLGHAFYQAVVEAAVPEELMKFAVLYFYCVRLEHFDEPMDGLVYGVTASLGFAAFENVLYVAEGGMNVAIMRAVSAVPSHALNGAIMGYFIAHYRFDGAGGGRWLFLSLAVPILFHGIWNFSLFAAPAVGGGLLLAAPITLGLQYWIVKRSYLHFNRLQVNDLPLGH